MRHGRELKSGDSHKVILLSLSSAKEIVILVRPGLLSFLDRKNSPKILNRPGG
jgi:hypothetical protein